MPGLTWGWVEIDRDCVAVVLKTGKEADFLVSQAAVSLDERKALLAPVGIVEACEFSEGVEFVRTGGSMGRIVDMESLGRDTAVKRTALLTVDG